jgi:peroxiredoxin
MKNLLILGILALGLNAHALEVGDTAPCVVLNQVQTDNLESEHCIRDHKETQQFTLIEFFSITCSACMANLPGLSDLGAKVSATATTRMVSIDKMENDVRTFISNNRSDLPFEIALDLDRDAKKAYGVISTPTLFILNSDNEVIYKHEGILSTANQSEIECLVSGCL